jgi:C4-dicarboxylate transporter, DctQ subunit
MPHPLTEIFAFIAAIYNKIMKIFVGIGAVLIVVMMLSIGGSVVFRRTAIDFAWALEASEYILIVSTLLGAAWLLKTGGHVRVDIVATHMHGRMREFYNGIIFVIVSLVCLAFILIGGSATWEAYVNGVLEEKVYMRFPKWILMVTFPIAGIFMFVESTKSAVAHFKKAFSR